MTKGDIIIIVTAIALVAATWAGLHLFPKNGQDLVVIVKVDGREVARVRASSHELATISVHLKGGTAVIQYGQGKARVLPDPGGFCPDGICWKTGWISRPGQSAVCVPNRMTLTLSGVPSDIDAVVR